MEVQLTTATVRDGVDTRKKENSDVPREVRRGDNLSVEEITGLGNCVLCQDCEHAPATLRFSHMHNGRFVLCENCWNCADHSSDYGDEFREFGDAEDQLYEGLYDREIKEVDDAMYEELLAKQYESERDPTFLLPPGADKVGTRMHGFWTNYMSLADRYIRHEEDAFMWIPYDFQQQVNERYIQQECQRLGNGEGMLNVLRQFYNRQVVSYMHTPCDSTLEYAHELLAEYNKELDDQNKAAIVIQRAFRISETGTLIAEDEYEEPFATRQNAIPSCMNDFPPPHS
jgi:hypothetical protein